MQNPTLSIIIYKLHIYATVAQLVEQLIRNQQVAGSSPASSSKKFRSRMWAEFLFFSLPIINSSFKNTHFSENINNTNCKVRFIALTFSTGFDMLNKNLRRFYYGIRFKQLIFFRSIGKPITLCCYAGHIKGKDFRHRLRKSQ